MRAIGFDKDGAPEILPDDLDGYYSGPAKRFLHITRIELEYDVPLIMSGDRIQGDFSLLRAFMADHDRDLFVNISDEKEQMRLFFPSYFYGFVEDTFARAIHHKIEGGGYAIRECIGKYEIRIREYDRLALKMENEDHYTAFVAACLRLKDPANLSPECRMAYEDIVRRADAAELSRLYGELEGAASCFKFLCENEFIDKEAAAVLSEELGSTRDSELLAILLKYQRPAAKRLFI